jgi:hypothetical protein
MGCSRFSLGPGVHANASAKNHMQMCDWNLTENIREISNKKLKFKKSIQEGFG